LKGFVLLFSLALLSCFSLSADSLLNRGDESTSPYKKRPRARIVYDYRVHDTIILDISIKDTLEFTKKHDTKRDLSWGAKIKNFITHFGGQNETGLPNVEIESKNEFKSDGKKKDGSNVRLKIPAEVIELLPNGDLVLEAKRTIWISEDSATVRVGGRVNPKFIENDAVAGENMLQLAVSTESKGPLSDNEKRGFISRFLDKFKPI